MIRVISSPSSSTTGFVTLIFAIADLCERTGPCYGPPIGRDGMRSCWPPRRRNSNEPIALVCVGVPIAPAPTRSKRPRAPHAQRSPARLHATVMTTEFYVSSAAPDRAAAEPEVVSAAVVDGTLAAGTLD